MNQELIAKDIYSGIINKDKEVSIGYLAPECFAVKGYYPKAASIDGSYIKVTYENPDVK